MSITTRLLAALLAAPVAAHAQARALPVSPRYAPAARATASGAERPTRPPAPQASGSGWGPLLVGGVLGAFVGAGVGYVVGSRADRRCSPEAAFCGAAAPIYTVTFAGAGAVVGVAGGWMWQKRH